MAFDIGENLKQLPASPGVYLHKNADGEVIYVGKASSLRTRVRQYFRPRGQDAKTAALASHIASFEVIVTKTEAEALLLENTLIKRYRPLYNIMLRDDKTYPYIKVTLAEEWPRVLKTRVLAADGSRYFGPYADVGAVNRIVALLNDVYRLKRCAHASFPRGHRACLHGHIDRCRKVCAGEADHDDYMADISRVMDFLKGRSAEVERYITARMNGAADRLDYEDAARWRDYLASARAVTEKQRVDLLSSGSMDVVLASGGADATRTVTVFFVRDGKLVGRERHMMDADTAGNNAETVAAFLSQYYSQVTPPREILLEAHIPDEELIADALCEGAGHRVHIRVPQRGAMKELVRLAQNDVGEAQRAEARRAEAAAKKRERLAAQIAEVFGIDGAPRIEAYDISHTGGADSVGGMVVFSGGAPDKSAYRRFKIRSDAKGDDYAAMQEVLYRRLKRGLDRDKGFLPLPDIILIDGGRGHLSAALQVIEAMAASASAADAAALGAIRTAGMVKDDSHRTRALILPSAPARSGEQPPAPAQTDSSSPPSERKPTEQPPFAEHDLKKTPELYHLTGRIQEEAHRFAIGYHRKRRSKKMLGGD